VSRTLGSTDTGLTVRSGLVGKTEFTEVSADHIELDFDIGEFFTSVDTDNRSDHFGKDDGISEVSLDSDGLFTGLNTDLGLSELLDKSGVFMLKTSVESSSDSGSEVALELISVEGNEIFEGETSEGVLLGRTVLSLFTHIYLICDFMRFRKLKARVNLANTSQSHNLLIRCKDF